MIEFFSYGFIERAMIVGALVSLCAALLGAKRKHTVEVNAPAGIMKYKILDITK